jgi:peptidoglycan/xylan/chitin deacetylase (PgdA/CDA1 family)
MMSVLSTKTVTSKISKSLNSPRHLKLAFFKFFIRFIIILMILALAVIVTYSLYSDIKDKNYDGILNNTVDKSVNNSTDISSASSISVNSSLISNQQEKVIKNKVLKIPVLMYHRINNLDGVDKKDAVNIGLRVNPTVLEEQLKYLKQNNYIAVSSEQIYKHLYLNEALPNKSILLTFDDGYKDNFIYAFPLLKKYNMIGEFAIITKLVGQQDYMTWQDLNNMKESGMSFSSHTLNHCYLAAIDTAATKSGNGRVFLPTPTNVQAKKEECPSVNYGGQLNINQVRSEVLDSKQILEEKSQVKIYSLVYPFGNFNNEVMTEAKKAGYYFAFTVKAQKNEELNFATPFDLPRYRVFGQQELPLTNFFAGNR